MAWSSLAHGAGVEDARDAASACHDVDDLVAPFVVLHQRAMVAGGRRYDVLDAAGRRCVAWGARGRVGLQPFRAYAPKRSETPVHEVRPDRSPEGGDEGRPIRLNEGQWREDRRWPLEGAALIAGLYLNELLLKLWPLEGRSAVLARVYVEALEALSDGRDVAWTLRRIEWALFVALDLGVDAPSEAWPCEPERPDAAAGSDDGPALWFVLQRGWCVLDAHAAPGAQGVRAASLRRWTAVMRAYLGTPQARSEDDWFALFAHLAELDPGLVRGLRDVHRLILHQALGGQTLDTRQLWQEPIARR